jgi:hypothetical protein
LTEGSQKKKGVKKLAFQGNSSRVFRAMPRKRGGKEGGEGGSGTQKRGPTRPAPPDAVGANKKTSTPNTSDRSTKTKTTNLNLAQGTKVDLLRTATSCFDKVWNAFA